MSCGSGSSRDAKKNSSKRTAGPARTSPGFKRFVVIRTGDRTYCIIGEWDSFQSLAGARPKMIAMLDTFRDTLEDLGGGLGVTDPVSGEVVLEI